MVDKRKKHLKNNFGAIVLMLSLTGVVLFYSHEYGVVKKNNTAILNREYTSRTDNENCLKCHARSACEIRDTADSTKTVTHYLLPQNIIDTTRFYSSNHWNFKCTDCHSDEYLKQPHDPALKTAPMSTCLDCHGGDENYAKYHFEDIDTACISSIHYKADSMNFACWICHNAHYDKLSMRDTLQEAHQVIQYDNTMCLNCHGKGHNYHGNYGTDSIKTDMMAIHQWLPEAEVHLNNLRCIDCHAAVNDSMMVSHHIRPKEQAVKDCKACHIENSLLLKTLYKNRPASGKKKARFLKTIPIDGKAVLPKVKKYPVLNFILLSLSALLLIVILFIVFRHLIPYSEKNHKK